MTTPEHIKAFYGLSEDRYNNLVLDRGIENIMRQPLWSEQGKKHLLKSKVYWAWWWRNWTALDTKVIEAGFPQDTVEDYLQAHDTAHVDRLPMTPAKWRVLEVIHD